MSSTLPQQKTSDSTVAYADVVNVARYAEMIKIIDPKADENEVNLTLQAINSFIFAYNNERTNMSANEALHHFNDALHAVIRSQMSKDSDKQMISVFSLLGDMLIDIYFKKQQS